jgi:hypothetical protein
MLVGAAPDGWYRLVFDFMTIGRHVSVAFAARMNDGDVLQIELPTEISKPLPRLRRGMYREGQGTWYSLDLVIDRPATYRA